MQLIGNLFLDDYLANSLIAIDDFETAREQLHIVLDIISEQGQQSRDMEIMLSCAKLFIGLGQDAGDLLLFLRDGASILPAIREQAADLLAAVSLTTTASRYQSLEEVVTAVQQQLSSGNRQKHFK